VKQVICKAGELQPGEVLSTKLGPMPIVVVRTEAGRLYAILDKCLHMGGALSKGKLLVAQNGRQCGDYHEEEGRFILKCPWHGYEYDLTTGATLFDPELKLRTFSVREEDGQIVVEA
jgi:nitrite reductase/ring-hydroxylating ferredoxin subunit